MLRDWLGQHWGHEPAAKTFSQRVVLQQQELSWSCPWGGFALSGVVVFTGGVKWGGVGVFPMLGAPSTSHEGFGVTGCH